MAFRTVKSNDDLSRVREEALDEPKTKSGLFMATENHLVEHVVNEFYDIKTDNGQIDAERHKLATQAINDANPRNAEGFERGQLVIVPYVSGISFQLEGRGTIPNQNVPPNNEIPEHPRWHTVKRGDEIGVGDYGPNCSVSLYFFYRLGEIQEEKINIGREYVAQFNGMLGFGVEVPVVGGVAAEAVMVYDIFLATKFKIFRWQLQQEFMRKRVLCHSPYSSTETDFGYGEPEWVELAPPLETRELGDPVGQHRTIVVNDTIDDYVAGLNQNAGL